MNIQHTVGENDEIYRRYGIDGVNHTVDTEQLCEVVRALESDRAQLLDRVYDLQQSATMHERREANYNMALAPAYDRLIKAASAALDRWDSPSWQDAKPTAATMHELRKALSFFGKGAEQ